MLKYGLQNLRMCVSCNASTPVVSNPMLLEAAHISSLMEEREGLNCSTFGKVDAKRT